MEDLFPCHIVSEAKVNRVRKRIHKRELLAFRERHWSHCHTKFKDNTLAKLEVTHNFDRPSLVGIEHTALRGPSGPSDAGAASTMGRDSQVTIKDKLNGKKDDRGELAGTDAGADVNVNGARKTEGCL
jgi:hypothetical protein